MMIRSAWVVKMIRSPRETLRERERERETLDTVTLEAERHSESADSRKNCPSGWMALRNGGQGGWLLR